MRAPATTIWFDIAADGIPSKDGCVNGRTSGRRTARPRRLGAQSTARCAGRSSFPPSSTASTRCAASASTPKQKDHHPDIDIRWRTVTFALVTHSEGGITREGRGDGSRDRRGSSASSRRSTPASPASRRCRPDPAQARYHGRLISQMVGCAKLSSHGTPTNVSTSQPQPRTCAPRASRSGPCSSQIISGISHTQWCVQEIGESSRPNSCTTTIAPSRSLARRRRATPATRARR